ncbi:MAG: Phenylacetic acid degradation operon transcriptional regulator, paaX family [Parcubacteria group bacterium GW2011_GWA1_47_8]|uniref:Phenylacetic acid degradation operon transcriptional regulator, paaX family n=1 Tax=Candidatus Gottesmanbacteria bacterium GW2011_GWA2_42_18 TaxID=1618442 RepID=A0A0G0ZBX0_9BACT|nr:MAG: Phenylacetic acid degradation operon transcriptional regulator, paaX family [Candidatus Gottesmanbacteria bacterium GW2011_GWA2_42_18]KKU81585.1 MAG: Phenylacetic acid degradation operon transcriptional regulator, paaX family [Parcubacteria group bacterium GW2011_GWA1_47_8]
MAIKDTTKEAVAEIILSTLLVAGVFAVAIMAPNAVQLFKYFGKKTPHEQWRIRRSATRLEKRGLIGKRSMRGEEYYVLTPTGKERAMRYKIKNMTIRRQKKWDGLWRIVMFDIPEDKKLARRAISHAIQKLGCLQYQKSVFITPYPCEKEIDFAGECFGVRKYIRIITAKDVEGINSIKKHFNV